MDKILKTKDFLKIWDVWLPILSEDAWGRETTEQLETLRSWPSGHWNTNPSTWTLLVMPLFEESSLATAPPAQGEDTWCYNRLTTGHSFKSRVFRDLFADYVDERLLWWVCGGGEEAEKGRVSDNSASVLLSLKFWPRPHIVKPS